MVPPQRMVQKFKDLVWYAIGTSTKIAGDIKPKGSFKKIEFAADNKGNQVAIAVIKLKKEEKDKQHQLKLIKILVQQPTTKFY